MNCQTCGIVTKCVLDLLTISHVEYCRSGSVTLPTPDDEDDSKEGKDSQEDEETDKRHF
jgi:hypothetical protein